MKKVLIGLVVTLWFCNTQHVQASNQLKNAPKPQVKALNNYVNFINESIDGLLLVHRLMANYNQELNKYVDLESHKVNDFGNKDLPQDIFEDPENWFYDPSPYQWFDIAKRESSVLQQSDRTKLNALATKYKQKLSQINRIRFDLDGLTVGKDMTVKDNINPVYQKLESAVTLFDGLYSLQKKIEKVLNEIYDKYKAAGPNSAAEKLYTEINKSYNASRLGLIKLKEKETKNMDAILQQEYVIYDKLKSIVLSDYDHPMVRTSKFKQMYSGLVSAVQQFNLAMTRFHQAGDVPQEHKQYGKFYYYYNISVIAKFNTYGEGITRAMNDITDYLQLDVLRGLEMPHYFKVIYPKKIKKLDKIIATDTYIEAIPEILKDRKVVAAPKKMRVESSEVELLLYDHMIQDGDIVSINFNGDWILENATLETTPQRVRLQLNEGGKNFIILHADSVGRRPPNTIAISYIYKGQKKEYILKSDYETSQLVEFLF